MKNLFATVGRQSPKCVGEGDSDSELDIIQAQAKRNFTAQGYDLSQVKFDRAEQESPPKKSKGK